MLLLLLQTFCLGSLGVPSELGQLMSSLSIERLEQISVDFEGLWIRGIVDEWSLPPQFDHYKATLEYYLRMSKELRKSHPHKELVFSCYAGPCSYSEDSSLTIPGFRIRVGAEFTYVYLGSARRLDQPTETNRVYASVSFQRNMDEQSSNKTNTETFLVSTGAAVSALTYEDFLRFPADLQLGLVYDTSTSEGKGQYFVSTKLWVSKIDTHDLVPPVLARYVAPLHNNSGLTQRIMGLELLEHFPHVRFHCGRLEFFTTPVPSLLSDDALKSSPRALTNPLQWPGMEEDRFRVDVTFGGREGEPVMIDTGDSHSFSKSTAVFTEGMFQIVEIGILGRSFHVAHRRLGSDNVLGMDILQEFDIHMIRLESGNETKMFIQQCQKEEITPPEDRKEL